MDHQANPKVGRVHRARFGFASRPEFYLIYLLFYFSTWFFQLPTIKDIVAIIIAILTFLPIYFASFEKSTPKYIPHIIVIELIGLALAPFHGAAGVFHVYACCHAAFQRPLRVGVGLFALLTVFYGGVSYLLKIHPIEIAMIAFMGLIIGVGLLAAAEQIEYQKLKDQAVALDHKMVATGERERIARDLHDVLGHTLTMVALKSQIAEKLLESDPQKAKEELRQIHESARHALKDVRETVEGMSITTLEAELSHAKKALKTARIELTVHGTEPDLTDHQSKMVGLCLRELVTNIIRHSGASCAEVSFTQNLDEVLFVIKDDGQVQHYQEGTGISGVRHRAANLGGHVDVTSQDGMNISISIPLVSPNQSRAINNPEMISEIVS